MPCAPPAQGCLPPTGNAEGIGAACHMPVPELLSHQCKLSGSVSLLETVTAHTCTWNDMPHTYWTRM